MSLCFPSDGSVSCGACCGLFNLKLESKGYKILLEERTVEFEKTVDFKVKHSLPAFRQSRELIESSYEKFDEMTYNCPFLGYVETEKDRIGCMIHPRFSGDPKSQNYSFYGASICQYYDCKNKENPEANKFQTLFLKVGRDSVEYSHLASDHIFCFALERWLVLKNWKVSEGLIHWENLILQVFKNRAENIKNKYPTSFEILYEKFSDLEEIYEYLENALDGKNKIELIERLKNAPEKLNLTGAI